MQQQGLTDKSDLTARFAPNTEKGLKQMIAANLAATVTVDLEQDFFLAKAAEKKGPYSRIYEITGKDYQITLAREYGCVIL